MICRLQTDEERRNVRLRFYNDPVFVISHSVLRARKCCLTPEEVFCTAERFVDFLLKIDVSEEELISTEIDLFKDDCADEELCFQILVTSIMKLSALRKNNLSAKAMVYLLLPHCSEHKDFMDVLGQLDRAEQKRIVDKGRVDLLKYELITLSEEECPKDVARRVVDDMVSAVLQCDCEVIKSAHIAFATFNSQQGNIYDEYERKLLHAYLDGQNQESKDKQVIINYVMKLHPNYVNTDWRINYQYLWREILEIDEVRESIYDRGRQKNTTFNRNLVGNILRIMILKNIVFDKASELASVLEGSADSSIRQQLGTEPSSRIIKQKIRQLIESCRKKTES